MYPWFMVIRYMLFFDLLFSSCNKKFSILHLLEVNCCREPSLIVTFWISGRGLDFFLTSLLLGHPVSSGRLVR